MCSHFPRQISEQAKYEIQYSCLFIQESSMVFSESIVGFASGFITFVTITHRENVMILLFRLWFASTIIAILCGVFCRHLATRCWVVFPKKVLKSRVKMQLSSVRVKKQYLEMTFVDPFCSTHTKINRMFVPSPPEPINIWQPADMFS